jgi:hypothetical protein
VGTVAVPAGTFDDCWQRTASAGDSFTASRTYCPKVGPVEFSNSNGEQATLLSYSVK